MILLRQAGDAFGLRDVDPPPSPSHRTSSRPNKGPRTLANREHGPEETWNSIVSIDNMYKAGDVANGHVLNQAGQWMPHPIGFRDERTRVAPAVKAATAKRRPTLRESAERWYSIFWLLAMLSAIGVWIALGATTAGAVGFGVALTTGIAWLPVIAFFNVIRKEL